MRKIYFILILLTTFFIGSISVSAKDCVYSDGNTIFKEVNGAFSIVHGVEGSFQNQNIDTSFKTCGKIYSYYLSVQSKRIYYLYSSKNSMETAYNNVYEETRNNPGSPIPTKIDSTFEGKEIQANGKKLECTYSIDETYEIKCVSDSSTCQFVGDKKPQGNAAVFIDDAILKKSLRFTCDYPIYGYMYLVSNAKQYKLYSNKSLMKQEKEQTQKGSITTTDIEVKLKKSTVVTTIPDNLDCKYSDDDNIYKLIIKDGNAKLDDAEIANLQITDDFKNSFNSCVSNVYVLVHYPYSGAIRPNAYLYATDAYAADSYYTGSNVKTLNKVTSFNGGSGNDDYEGDYYGDGNGGSIGNVKSCGHGTLKNIPSRIIKIINTIVRIIQIAVPILIIIFGMIDFGKSVMAQKPDEMQKAQKTFITRLVTGILVFLVIVIVKVAVRFVADQNENSKIMACVDCFISGKCD